MLILYFEAHEGAELEGSLAHDVQHCLLERERPLSKVCGRAAPHAVGLGGSGGSGGSRGSGGCSEPRQKWSFSGKGQAVTGAE